MSEQGMSDWGGPDPAPKPAPPLDLVGRLAMRREGDLWVAYYAPPTTMDGSMYLASIQITLIEAVPARRQQFLALMGEIVADLIEMAYGARPTMGGTAPAPESERGLQVPNAFLK